MKEIRKNGKYIWIKKPSTTERNMLKLETKSNKHQKCESGTLETIWRIIDLNLQGKSRLFWNKLEAFDGDGYILEGIPEEWEVNVFLIIHNTGNTTECNIYRASCP